MDNSKKALLLLSIMFSSTYPITTKHNNSNPEELSSEKISFKNTIKLLAYCLEFTISGSAFLGGQSCFLIKGGEAPSICGGVHDCQHESCFDGFSKFYFQLPMAFSLLHSSAGIFEQRRELKLILKRLVAMVKKKQEEQGPARKRKKHARTKTTILASR